MDKIAGVYEIRNILNGSRYIGSSIDIKRRFIKHRYQLNHNKHINQHLQRAWHKYGKESFVFKILLLCDNKNTLVYEQIYLDHCKPEYNIVETAGAPFLGKHFTKEHRKNLSKALKGRVITKRARRLIGEANKGNNYWKGRKHTEESKEKMRQYRLGKILSKETKEKISKKLSGKNHPLYGKHHTKEAREKISKNHADVSGKNNPNYGGHPHSEETKRKISEGLKRHYANKKKAGDSFAHPGL